MLQNEKHIGNLVYARFSCKLRSKQVINPPEQWIHNENVFAGIIPRELFFKARMIYQARRRQRFTDAEMLQKLRGLWEEHGYISCRLVDQTNAMPTAMMFKNRFGGMVNAHQMIGFKPRITRSRGELDGRLVRKTQELVAKLTQQLEQAGALVRWQRRTPTLVINHQLRVGVILLRHSLTEVSTSRWIVRRRASAKPDFTIAARMDFQNEDILDYYLFPGLDPVWKMMRLGERNGAYLDAYRFESLDFLLGMATQIKLHL